MKQHIIKLAIIDLVSPEFSVASLDLKNAKAITVNLSGLFPRQFVFGNYQAPLPANPKILENLNKIADALVGNTSVRKFNIITPTDRPGKRIWALGAFLGAATTTIMEYFFWPRSVTTPVPEGTVDLRNDSAAGDYALPILGGIALLLGALVSSILLRLLLVKSSETCDLFNKEIKHFQNTRLHQLHHQSVLDAKQCELPDRIMQILNLESLTGEEKKAIVQGCDPVTQRHVTDKLQVQSVLAGLAPPPPVYVTSSVSTVPGDLEKGRGLQQPLLGNVRPT